MMRKTLFLCLVLALFSGSLRSEELPLVPLPVQVEMGQGHYQLPTTSRIFCPRYAGDSIHKVAARFAHEVERTTGLCFRSEKRQRKANIRLLLDEQLGAEAYRLEVGAKGITVHASRPAGFFYALQTLKQLMPANVMAGVADSTLQAVRVPQVRIADAPRFEWRGFMLDEGRHFFGKEEVMRVLDVMAAHKMNRFHWHLTEDQGWRIEIKKYPRLTSVGAWRKSRTLPWGEVKADTLHYGGYYSQDDVREIVAYARERFIEILPEIDMPGHFQAALAAYPELSCDPENPHHVWVGQGVSADVMNVAAPAALQFTKDVVDELTALFPFGYIHLGGDECPTYKWERNAQCQALLKEIGSEKWRDLQTHFYKQVQDHIAAKPQTEQRRLIFWNEALHGNTSALGDATFMAWIGADGAALDAARRGFDNILSPQIPYYINRRQSKDADEPATQGYGDETLERVYAYAPAKNVPDSLLHHYKGVQANFWTEWVIEPSTLEYLLLPRLAAVAEAGWTPQARRDFADFRRRMRPVTHYYKQAGLHFCPKQLAD